MSTTRISIVTFVAGIVMMPALLSAQTTMGTSFTYQGYLTDEGAPADGPYDFIFILYDGDYPEGSQVGDPIYRDGEAVDRGLFTVVLDFGGEVFLGDARWLEIAVRETGDPGPHSILAPRQKLTPTPYAQVGSDTLRIGGWPVDTAIPAEDDVLKWDGMMWSPAVDVDTLYTAGDGLTLTDGEFALDIAYVDTLFVGEGEAGCVGTVMLQDLAVTTAKLDDQAVTTPTLADFAVTDEKILDVHWSKIIGTPSSFPPGGTAGGDLSGSYPGPLVAGLQGRLVSSGTPASGHVLKWSGSQWAPATDRDTTYSAGTGLVLSGTTFSLSLPYADGRYVNEGQSGSISSGMLQSDSVTSAKIASSAVTTAKLANDGVTSAKLAHNIDATGIGFNADKLDGYHAGSFLTPATDYGRSGVASALYESNTSLTNKYVNESGDSMSSSTSGSVLSVTNSGSGRGVYGESAGGAGAGLYGKATGSSGNGVEGLTTGSSGAGVYGQGVSAGGMFFGGGPSGAGVTGSATYSGSSTNYGGYFTALGTYGVGVFGDAPSNGYAGYFDGRGYFAGKVGVGVTSPSHSLSVQNASADDVLRLIGPEEFGSGARLNFGDSDYVYLDEYDDDELRIYASDRLHIQTGGTLVVDLGSIDWPTNKPATVKLDDGRKVKLYAEEAAEVLFSDYGDGQLHSGFAHVALDPEFAQTVTIDDASPMRVFVQLEGDCNGVYVTNKTASGFDVVERAGGTSDAPFTYRVVCTRKHYAGLRLATEEEDIEANRRMYQSDWPERVQPEKPQKDEAESKAASGRD